MTEPHPNIPTSSVVRGVEVSGRRATVVVQGEIDISTVSDLSAALQQCIADACESIAVDMRNVTFIDSAGLACLAAASNALRPEGSLVVEEPSRVVSRLLDISGMSGLLTLDGARRAGSADLPGACA